MQHATSIAINRPADEVFEYLVDHRNDVEWRAVERSALVAGAPGEPGARYEQVLLDDGEEVTTSIETVRADPASRTVSFTTVDDPEADLAGTYTVSDDGASWCDVQFACELRPHGWRRLLAPLLGGNLRRMSRAYLESLKQTLEGAPPADPTGAEPQDVAPEDDVG